MHGESPIEQHGADVYLNVRVQPKASRRAIRIEPDGLIRVSVTAPPAEGAANKALVEFFADIFDLPKRAIGLRSGHKGRNKTVVLAGITVDAAKRKLAQAAANEKLV